MIKLDIQLQLFNRNKLKRSDMYIKQLVNQILNTNPNMLKEIEKTSTLKNISKTDLENHIYISLLLYFLDGLQVAFLDISKSLMRINNNLIHELASNGKNLNNTIDSFHILLQDYTIYYSLLSKKLLDITPHNDIN